MIRTFRNKHVIWLSIAIFAAAAVINSGCGAFESLSSIAGLDKTGTVINRSWVRSSFSVVAADLLEVKRGQSVDILEEVEFERVKWYRVRAHDEDNTEGWIEAQNIITSEMLDKSKKLAQEDKDLQPQATGRLRAVSNLRLAPDLNPENILYKLESSATFDIISWKYVPKAQDAADVDDVSKTGASGGSDSRAALARVGRAGSARFLGFSGGFAIVRNMGAAPCRVIRRRPSSHRPRTRRDRPRGDRRQDPRLLRPPAYRPGRSAQAAVL